MNANFYNIELRVERGQVEEAILSIFHTILLHRTTGKYSYSNDSTSYSISSIGLEDVDCEFLDLTFVKVASKELDSMIKKHIVSFRDQLQQHTHNDVSVGTISLEFYQKRRNRWPFNDECVPWEIWNLQITESCLAFESNRNMVKEAAAMRLSDKIASVIEAIGRNDFVPKTPDKVDLPLVYDTSLPDIQPFLFKISNNFGNVGFGSGSPNKTITVGSTVRKLFRDMTI